MQSRILGRLTKHYILTTEHYGLRTSLKTDNATYKLTTEILSAVNIKLLVGVIFCDIGKAFYCVDHDILLVKFKFYGINGRVNHIWKIDIIGTV